LVVLADQLSEALSLITDVASELAAYLDDLPTDASALETKLARQAQLRTLTRKYAADVDGVLAWAREARERLTQLDLSEEALTALARAVDDLAAQVAAAATDLTKARTKAAKGLSKAVTSELSGLAMGDAEFTITVQPLSARPGDSAPLVLPVGTTVHAGSSGTDVVEFGFTAHKGAAMLPVTKSASGGELSRLMLALEVVLAASAEGTTMVFDEVDAGIGGRAAVQIGRRLARLARTHQVIVVTHLPQVAAYADVHLVVDAGSRDGANVVRRVDDDERVAELARMLAGLGESDTARAHARELLETAAAEPRHR
jgi:DNA repair protein RecN (Recombination protein N)